VVVGPRRAHTEATDGFVQIGSGTEEKLVGYTLPVRTLSKDCNGMWEARPQSKFPTRPAASKPYIARSDCAYVIEQ
jgi:hypothetical protein